MHSMFSYLKTMLRTFILIILTKDTNILPGFEAGPFGSKEHCATRTLSWQFEKNYKKIKKHSIKA